MMMLTGTIQNKWQDIAGYWFRLRVPPEKGLPPLWYSIPVTKQDYERFNKGDTVTQQFTLA